jgi:hypothetical protein
LISIANIFTIIAQAAAIALPGHLVETSVPKNKKT